MIQLPEGVTIEEMNITLSQESDSCQEQSEGQVLTVSTPDAGGGKYLIIKTERWAICGDDSEVDAFATMLKQILKEAQ